MVTCIAIILCVCSGNAGAELRAIETSYQEARRRYDQDAVRDVITRQRERITEDASNDRRLLYVRSLLGLAELLRIEFESLPEKERAQRRELGREIDAAAREALSHAARLTESSESFRLTADLYGVMIRSEYRAKKYRKKLDAAVEQALALDANNSRAYVTKAATYIFADKRQGGDPVQGIALLNTALSLAPNLEPALLLRAFAYDKLNRRDKAVADLRHVVALNPDCRPAVERLEHYANDSE